MARILLVDDEVENLSALKRALGDENDDWEILTASDEKEAKSIIKKQARRSCAVDVVLTDLVMDSEESGMKVLKEARRLDPLAMTILFTAKEKSLDRYAAFDLGAFDVVEKNIRGASAVREIMIKTRAALRYREWAKRINFLKRYFDPKVFNQIEKDPTVLSLQTRTVTIVFWDIRGFSRLCESLKAHPTLISGFLKEYCDLAAQQIFRCDGVLDKFIGDGIMALFGVLSEDGEAEGEKHAQAAVRAALELRKRFPRLQGKWMEQWQLYVPDQIDIGLGCGIHTGEVLVGNVGTEFRDQFTALGPHVNFASRIEGRAAAGQIILSQSARARVKTNVSTVPAGEIADVKNIPGTFSLFEVTTE